MSAKTQPRIDPECVAEVQAAIDAVDALEARKRLAMQDVRWDDYEQCKWDLITANQRLGEAMDWLESEMEGQA